MEIIFKNKQYCIDKIVLLLLQIFNNASIANKLETKHLADRLKAVIRKGFKAFMHYSSYPYVNKDK